MSLAAGTRLGPYEVLGLIGAGGMGEVYRARDTRLDRTVAIKLLPAEASADPERRARFERLALRCLAKVPDDSGVQSALNPALAGLALAIDPAWAPLRGHPGFERLVAAPKP